MSKEYPEAMDMATLLEYLREFPLAHLATIDGDQPRVRAMALIVHNDELWLSTKTVWDKVRQLEENNRIELSIGIKGESGTGTARVTGRAIKINDNKIRSELAEAIPWFSRYWSSHDSDLFGLYRIEISKVLIDHPDDGKKYHVRC